MNLILPENIVFHFEKSHYHSKTIFVFFCKLSIQFIDVKMKKKQKQLEKQLWQIHGCVGGDMDSGFE